MKIKTISIYNLEKIKNLFFENKKIIAYGNGSFYFKVKEVLSYLELNFSFIATTRNNKVKLESIEDDIDVTHTFKNSIVFICSTYHDEIINIIKDKGLNPKIIIILDLDERIAFANKYKNKIVKKMQEKHLKLLANIKHKPKIKVVFLAILKSMWKVDSVFKKMLADPYFEPEILVCPLTRYGEERMPEDMEQAYNYFKNKGYPVTKSLKEDGSWTKLEEIKPDIVFFTNPHHLTRTEYYSDAYLSFLSCYIPYHHEIGNYSGNIDQYNQVFHNAQWLIFAPHQNSFETFKQNCQTKASNVHLTGYPMFEELFDDKKEINKDNVWKNDDKRLRVIWAPHHTIDNKILPFSNFLKYAYKIKKLAINNKSKAVWSFKPHPILKSKLYKHLDWGKKVTDDYYSFWEHQEYTQLDLGEYVSLFEQSDAMIHDSGSFLAEYLYFKKPALFTMSKNNNLSFFNDFGKKALSSYKIANSYLDIEKFIKNLLSNKNHDVTAEHLEFYEKELKIHFQPKLPSERVIDIIKSNINAPDTIKNNFQHSSN